MSAACASFAGNRAERARSVSIATLLVVSALLPSAPGGADMPAGSRERKTFDKPSTPARMGKVPLDRHGDLASCNRPPVNVRCNSGPGARGGTC